MHAHGATILIIQVVTQLLTSHFLGLLLLEEESRVVTGPDGKRVKSGREPRRGTGESGRSYWTVAKFSRGECSLVPLC